MTETGNQTVAQHLASVAAKSSTPGGGAVAAVMAAEACGLISMVANFTKTDLGDIQSRSTESIETLLQAADEDANAFSGVMAAYKGDGNLQTALGSAAQVPIQIIRICASHLEDLDLLVEQGNKNLITDVAIAASLLRSSFEACRFNVLINTGSMEQPAESLLAALKPIDDYMSRCDQINKNILNQLQ